MSPLQTKWRWLLTTITILLLTAPAPLRAVENSPSSANQTSWKFSFGTAKPKPGFLQVLPTATYSQEHGYGLLEPVIQDANADGDFCSAAPFLFSVDVPEGNYQIKATLGAKKSDSITTIKAEMRRLMVERAETRPGKFITRSFTVNVRYKELKNGGTVRLKNDEQAHLDWDHQLTLEFNNSHPCLRTLEIAKIENAITVYVAGDSTVTDQALEPWSAWGQMLPRFFKPNVAIANHAESGESLKSFIGEHRLEKILETLKAGDYLFIQFAHNDQKPGSSHVDAFTSYKDYLMKFANAARERKAIPVLVTSMHRRNFDSEGKIVNTLADYPEAMRQLAKTENILLIDLNSMSKDLYEALGPEGTLKAFVHYPAGTFPRQEKELKDDTHFNSYGAYELARCVVEGIRANKLGIAKYLRDDVVSFTPRHPDALSSWSLPPTRAAVKAQFETTKQGDLPR